MADGCRGLTDAMLAVLVARHEALESLQIGSDPLERVSSDVVRHVALFYSRLRRLRLSGLRDADADAIGALAHSCPLLEDVAFLDCGAVDEATLAVGAMIPASQMEEQGLIAYKKMELQRINDSLDQYLILYTQEKVQAEKVMVESDDVAKGLVELISEHHFTVLVVGAATDKHYTNSGKWTF